MLSVGRGPGVPGSRLDIVRFEGHSFTPSAVYLADAGRSTKLVVGREAERLARLAPERFEPNPKRRIDDVDLLLGVDVVSVQAAIAAMHAHAARAEDTDWAQIDLLYGTLEIMQPSPVVTLNRAVATMKLRLCTPAQRYASPRTTVNIVAS